LHDAIIGEGRNLPSVGILTEAFVDAGDLMARVLGAEGYRYAVVAHPISSATGAQLEARAREAAKDSAAILLGSY